MSTYSECDVCGVEGGGHTRGHYREMQDAQHADERTPPMAADDPRRDGEPPF
jgi:hypothetical protein